MPVAKKLSDMIRETGALEYCGRKIRDYSERAQASLEQLKDSQFKDYLIQFPDQANEFKGQLS
jgi:geranylgeranyl pyrophosphate synthase